MSAAEQNLPNDYELIEESGLFDRSFYLRANPDVAEASIDPLAHFCDYGWREGRDPTPYFSLSYYKAISATKDRILGNPFVHYLLQGRATGFRTRPEAMGPVEPIPVVRAAQWSGLTPRVEVCGIDVIIPVYRGLRDTAACIYSVLTAKGRASFRLIIVNDRSPEPDLTRLLNALARRELLVCLENDENLGFVGSVNRGMASDANAHKLLLNSDTIVYDGWLDRICAHADRDRVGTVTPLSNNATIFSYPDPNSSNNYSLELCFADLDLLASAVNKGHSLEVPTGVGFCMFIHKDCYREVGEFDANTFARGYGEENDFCIRAAGLRWKNIAATDVLVRHTGEVSFALDASNQQKAGHISLLKKHPRYEAGVRRFLNRDPFKPVRRKLDLARLSLALNRDAVALFIAHNQGGGIATNLEQLGALLGDDVGIVMLTPHGAGRPSAFSLNLLGNRLYVPNLSNLNESELLDALNALFRDRRNSVVHLHSAVGFDIKKLTSVLRRLRSWGIRVVSTLHDYSSICPRNHLIDDSDDFCGLPSHAYCNGCAKTELSSGANPDLNEIGSYRAAYEELLACAERTFVPSEDTRARLQPYLRRVRLEAKPHLEPVAMLGEAPRFRPREVPTTTPRLRVALIGAIGPHKGSSVLFGCASDAMKRKLALEFQVIGYTDIDERLQKVDVGISGPYFSREELRARIEMYAPDAAFFPSIWPETYLYTLSEAFNHGIFPVAFDIGAPAERILEAEWGALIDFDERFNFSFINDCLLELRDRQGNPAPPIPRRKEDPALYYGYPSGRKSKDAASWTVLAGEPTRPCP